MKINLQTTLQIISNPNLQPTNVETPDTLIWKPSTHGQFSTKSTYKIIHNQQHTTFDANTQAPIFFWKNKLIKPRIALFLWRLYMKNLPTSQRLSHRIPTISPMCRVCHLLEETDYHCFFTCQASRAVWFGSRLHIRADLITDSVPDFISRLHKELSHEDFAYAATLLWAIWEQRNQCLFNSTAPNPTQTFKRVEGQMGLSQPCLPLELPSTKTATNNTNPTDAQPSTDLHSLTIHTDAAWNLGRGGWGVIVKMDSTLQLYSCGSFISPCPLHAEATAMLQAVNIITQAPTDSPLSGKATHSYSDCKNMVDAILQEQETTDWQALRIIEQIRHKLKQMPHFTIQHVPTNFNTEAHTLAAVGRTLAEPVEGYQYPTFKPP